MTSEPWAWQASAIEAQPSAQRSANGARSYGQSLACALAPSVTMIPHPPAARRRVVGGVAWREAAVVVAEVGDVRAEHDAVRRGGATQAERFEQSHDPLIMVGGRLSTP